MSAPGVVEINIVTKLSKLIWGENEVSLFSSPEYTLIELFIYPTRMQFINAIKTIVSKKAINST